MKTGADKDARSIPLKPKFMSVGELVALPRPENLSKRQKRGVMLARISPAETTLYQTNGTITGYKIEADGDYHLILEAGDETMIIEVPDPAMVSTKSPWRSKIKETRLTVSRTLENAGKRLKHTHVAVTVEGVGFWDKKHGQTGMARNGIELHPVLRIDFAE